MIAVSDATWYLERASLFEGLPTDDLGRLARMARLTEVPRGGTVSGLGTAICLVGSGRVRLVREAANGRRITQAYAAPGELFGELFGAPRQERQDQEWCYLAEAVEPSMLCRFDREAFQGYVSERPALCFKVATWIFSRLQRSKMSLVEMLCLDVRGRILKILDDLCEEHGFVTPLGRRLSIKLTHHDLASLIGATRESTSEALGHLRKSGAVAYDGRYLLLPSRDDLANP